MAKCGPFTLCGINSIYSLSQKISSFSSLLFLAYLKLVWFGDIFIGFVWDCTKRRANRFELQSISFGNLQCGCIGYLLSFWSCGDVAFPPVNLTTQDNPVGTGEKQTFSRLNDWLGHIVFFLHLNFICSSLSFLAASSVSNACSSFCLAPTQRSWKALANKSANYTKF